MDGHNGMSYTYLPSENYETAYNNFWQMTVPSTYTATCNYTQPGEYWPLFYADGIAAWYTQKIVVTSSGVVPSPITSPTPTPNPINGKILYSKGFNVIGFNGPVQTDLFGKNGFAIYDFNSQEKRWDVSTSFGEYFFQPNKAYYIYSDEDKLIDQIAPGQITTTSEIKISPGWNFVWLSDTTYLSGLGASIYSAQGQCLAKHMSIKTLKNDGIVYKWLYNVVDGSALDACSAFSLLTGRDQPSLTCSNSNPLLNEVSYGKAKSGLWVYLWPQKIDNYVSQNHLSCN